MHPLVTSEVIPVFSLPTAPSYTAAQFQGEQGLLMPQPDVVCDRFDAPNSAVSTCVMASQAPQQH